MFSRYYRFGGQPIHYAANWNGLPPSQVRRSLELGHWRLPARAPGIGLDILGAAGPRGISASAAGLANPYKRRRSLGDNSYFESTAPAYTAYPPASTAWARFAAASARDELSGIPLRPSGPEPLDPGMMPAWQDAYQRDPTVMSVGADDVPLPASIPTLGPGGTSKNEQRFLIIGGLAIAGLLFLRSQKKPRTNPARRRRRRRR